MTNLRAGPSKHCKEAGLYNLAELSELCGKTSATLISWYSKEPKLFNLVLLGALKFKEQNNKKEGDTNV